MSSHTQLSIEPEAFSSVGVTLYARKSADFYVVPALATGLYQGRMSF
jgi:hypothetical protein